MAENQIRRQLAALRAENRPSADLRATIELLIKITRNILPSNEPGAVVDPKFKQINPLNPDFNKKVWSSAACRQILMMSGWVRVGEGKDMRLFRFDDVGGDGADLTSQQLMNILLENRNVVPDEKEWIEETKLEKITTANEKFRQDQLRGAAEREKEYAAAVKEKKERKEMAENFKKELAADKAYRNQRYGRPN